MKPKEARRVNVVEQLIKGTITVSQAAKPLCLSDRQVKRIKKGVKEQGLSYLAHKNRGRKPKHAISEETCKKLVEVAYFCCFCSMPPFNGARGGFTPVMHF